MYASIRPSVGSLGDDQFFTAPSTRPASRHVSLSPTAEKHGQPGQPTATSVSVKSVEATDSSSSSSSSPAQEPPSQPRESLSAAEPIFQSLLAMKHRDSLQIGRMAHKAKAQGPSRMAPVAEGSDQVSDDPSDDDDSSTTIHHPSGDELDSPLDQTEIEGLVGNIQAFHISTPPVPTEQATTPPLSICTASSAPTRSSVRLGAVSPPTLIQNEIQAIVNNIQVFLSQRRHQKCNFPADLPRDSSLNVGQNTLPSHSAEESQGSSNFLVSTRDIAGILDIVIAGLRTLHDEHLSTGCLTVLLPTGRDAKPSTSSNALIPHCSGLADPATTISSVRSAFVLSGTKRESHRALRSLRATIITRQSVTEVNWDTSSESPGSSDDDNNDSSSNAKQAQSAYRSLSTCDTPHCESTPSVTTNRHNSATFGSANREDDAFNDATHTLERRPSSTPSQLGNRKKLSRKRLKLPASAPNEEDIISFPALRSRTCTNDWIRPPRQIEDLQREIPTPTRTMYECGIDAHACSPCVAESGQADGGLYPDWADQRDGHSPTQANSASSPGPPTTAEQRDKVDKKMGAGVGQSAGRRRSSSRLLEEQPPAPDNDLFNKLRRYSFAPLVEHIPETLRKDPIPRLLKPISDLTAGRERRKSGKEMLEDILAREQHPRGDS